MWGLKLSCRWLITEPSAFSTYFSLLYVVIAIVTVDRLCPSTATSSIMARMGNKIFTFAHTLYVQSLATPLKTGADADRNVFLATFYLVAASGRKPDCVLVVMFKL